MGFHVNVRGSRSLEPMQFFSGCLCLPSDEVGDIAVMLILFRRHLVEILATLTLNTEIMFGFDSMLNY
jgi:hypothetical protein